MKKIYCLSILAFSFFLFSGNIIAEEQELPIMVDFELFDGLNLSEVYPGWHQAKGMPPSPAFSNSAWFSADVLYGSNTAAVIYSYSGLKDEWIISPRFPVTETTRVSFMAALTRFWDDPINGNLSHNDSVNVMVATEGYNFTETVFSFKFANQPEWQPAYYDVDLSDYAGETIRIAFYATNGQEANSLAAFHLDDIVIKDALPQDALAFDLMVPAPNECFVDESPIGVIIKNDGLEPITNVPVRVRVRGATTQNLFGAYDGVIAPGEYAGVYVGSLNDTPYGTYHFEIETELPGDGFPYNNVKTGITREHSEARSLPLPLMNFVGFYTQNLGDIYPGWYEARGKDWPRVAMNTDWQGMNYDGARTANVYFTGLGTEDWMVGPRFVATDELVVELRAAVEYDWNTDQMGSDDKLAIMISTDCGFSWEEVGAFTQQSGVTESLQEFSFPIEGYGGEEVILAFYATTGAINDSESYLFHITDVKIKSLYNYDAGITHLLSPGNSCSFTSEEEVIVRIENFGLETIGNFDVAYSLNGQDPVVETFTGSLAYGETFDFTFTQTVDLSDDTHHQFSVYTLLENDENPDNDGLYDILIRLSSFDLTTEGAYQMGFEEDEDFDDWQVEDGNNDGITWELTHDPQHANSGEYSYAYFSNQSSVPSDDWLFSPCFNLEAGQTYYVSFYYKNRATNWPESLKLNIGNAPQGSAMDQLLIDLGQISNPAYQKAETTFTVPESGEYYFGWHAYGPADQFGMHIDDVTIYQVFEYDLALTNLVRPREKGENCMLQDATSVEVEISNFGEESVSSFSVGLMLDGGDPVLFDFTETIDSGESFWVVLENGFAIPPDQMVDIALWTHHPQDLNAANDTLHLLNYLMADYITSFDPWDDFSDWDIENLAGVNEWHHLENPSVSRTGDYVYAIRTDAAGGNTANDDWLYSECFFLEAETCYEISFYYRSHFSTENLAVYLGDAQTHTAMNDLLIDLPQFSDNNYQKATAQFTVEESGVYYFGWHTEGGTSGRYFIYIDDLSIVEDAENQPVANPEILVLDKEVAFFANAENAATYLWDFGDGNTSDQAIAFHTYDAPGSYDITLSLGSGCVDVTYDLHLELEWPIYQVTFDVVDESGSPVHDAQITVDGTQNEPGDYLFELYQGGYLFSVEQENHTSVSGNIAVIDEDMAVSVILPYEGELFTLTFMVVDDYGMDIPDAVVTLNEQEYDPGHYVFENLTPGSYDYIVTYFDFEPVEGTVEIVDEDVIVEVIIYIGVGTNDLSKQLFQVYPNPFSDNLNVKGDLVIDEYRLLDLSGQLVRQNTLETDQREINIYTADLQPGNYILRIYAEGKWYSVPLIRVKR